MEKLYKELESDLEELWKEYENESFTDHTPLIGKVKKEMEILFIGLNPSKSGDPYWKHKKDLIVDSYTSNTENSHKYFNKFKSLGEELKKPWDHLDLLYYRGKQKEVEKLERGKSLSFLYEQMMLTKEILKELKPKVVVVTNTKARQFLGKERYFKGKEEHNVWMDYKFEFDPEIGTDRCISEGNFNNVPFFFTSMLTGQRALDNGSFERLKWHIEQVLKKVN